MKLHVENGLEWLSFEQFTPFQGLTAACFTKKIGNLKPYTAEDLSTVFARHQKIQDHFSLNKIIFANQTHGSHVAIVTKESAAPIADTDGLLTTEKGLGLLIMHADCQCAIFYDPNRQACAAVHSGWRGSVQNIYKKTVDLFISHVHSNPEDILVSIGPSLSSDAAEFIHYKEEFPPEFWAYQTKENHFDFWAISVNQLLSCGILEKNIEIARMCTFKEKENFFSYRSQVKECGKGPLHSACGTLVFLL